MLLPSFAAMRGRLAEVIADKDAQGYQVAGLRGRLDSIPDSYDALAAFARELAELPLRPDWPHVEPDSWDGILAESDMHSLQASPVKPAVAHARIEAAFLARVAGCILGKPLEINPSLLKLKAMFSEVGQWPIDDYVPEVLASKHKLHGSWVQTVRERIQFVAPDDDINYTVLNMLLLEQFGLSFTQPQLVQHWLDNLAPGLTFGPERSILLKAALASYDPKAPLDIRGWVRVDNPRNERCGALIRADAYAYASLGSPRQAAELAFRDASLTHERTGVYGAMFVAAWMALLPIASRPLDAAVEAMKVLPRKSRTLATLRGHLADVRSADDFEDGWSKVHCRYRHAELSGSHCLIHEELGTLLNTMRFAGSTSEGICLQVMQGNDTDSYGATAGSLLGLCFGPASLDDRWLKPFRDTIHTSVCGLAEPSLSRVAKRMARLHDLPRIASSGPSAPAAAAGDGVA